MDGIRLPTSDTWTAARSAGVTRRQVDHHGIRLGRGLYLSRAVEPALAARCAAWVPVLPVDGASSSVAAAAEPAVAVPAGEPPAGTGRSPGPARSPAQLAVLDRWGQDVAHGDLGYSHGKVLLEYEGRRHAEREQFRCDVDRYSLMGADGWLVLRFADQHLGGPHTVVERTRRALVSRGWRRGRC